MEKQRPPGDGKRAGYKDSFEMCYLRHQYVRKAKDNPTPEEMKPYLKTIATISNKTYKSYRRLFKNTGLEVEDLVSISKVHLVSFLGLFSLEKMPDKYAAFVGHNANKTSKEVLKKNINNFSSFLGQRMNDLTRVCRQKTRNIKGLHTEEGMAFSGDTRPPLLSSTLLDSYESLGFKKISMSTYKAIRRKAEKKSKMFIFNGKWYICVSTPRRELSADDVNNSCLDPYSSYHHQDPESILINLQEEDNLARNVKEFKKDTTEDRINCVKLFIEANKNNPDFKVEVALAKKKLEKYKAV